MLLSRKIFLKKIKKMLAIFFKIVYTVIVLNKWLVGQEVKTSPSHGEISGSIPLRAAFKTTVVTR